MPHFGWRRERPAIPSRFASMKPIGLMARLRRPSKQGALRRRKSGTRCGPVVGETVRDSQAPAAAARQNRFAQRGSAITTELQLGANCAAAWTRVQEWRYIE